MPTAPAERAAIAAPHAWWSRTAAAPRRESLRLAWPTVSFRTYLVVLVLLGTLPIAALMVKQIFDDVRARQARTHANLQQAAGLLSLSVERELVSSIDALTILSYADAIQRDDVARFAQEMRSRARQRATWSSVYLADTDGNVLFDTAAPRARKYAGARGAAEAGSARMSGGRQPAISGLVDDRADRMPATAIEVPVVGGGSVRYVLGAWIKAADWQRMIDQAGTPAAGFMAIVDRRHRVIAHSPTPADFVGQNLPAGIVAALSARPAGVEAAEMPVGTSARAAWQTVPHAGWRVLVGVPATAIDAADREAIVTALTAATACLLLGVLLALLAARHLTRPLHKLATNDLTTPAERIAVREISRLRDALLSAQAQDEDTRARLKLKSDLIERKAAEFETLFDNSPIGLAFAQDPQCNVVLHNTAMGVLVPAPDAPAAATLQVLCGGRVIERDEQPLYRAAAHGESVKGLELEIRIDGRPPTFLLVSAVPLTGAGGRPRGAIGAVVDITTRKLAEARLISAERREQAARHEAEAANRSKDEFLAMLGHELRNPLNAIASAAEVLNRMNAGGDDACAAREIIARQTRHLAHMMDDLLDVARVVSGKVRLARHSLDWSALVRSVVSTLEVTGDARRHTLTADIEDIWIDADATRVEQVVSNLIVNALKYTPDGGRIDVALRRDGADGVLEVRDTGVGIAASLLPHVFDLFVQGERTLDRRAGGLGIGLTLVRRLVELQDGSVEAESSAQGSTFRVRFPAIAAPAGFRERNRMARSQRRHVAVIEDNEDALAALRSLLELDGHRVDASTEGERGLAALLELRPDVAVVDIGLPGLSGFEVARRSRAAGYAGRLIALSGYGQEQGRSKAMASGFDAYLVKPVEADELRRLLAGEGDEGGGSR